MYNSKYLRKRFLDDVCLQRRSLSAPSLVDDVAFVPDLLSTNKAELVNVTMDLLEFRRCAITACQNLMHSFSNEVLPFFKTMNEAVNYIQNLENNWISSWKTEMVYIDKLIAKLKEKHATYEGLLDELPDDGMRGIPGSQTLSDDEASGFVEIPKSRLFDMLACLDKSVEAQDMAAPSTSQTVFTEKPISKRLQLQTELQKKNDCGESDELMDINFIGNAILAEIPDDTSSLDNFSLKVSSYRSVIIPKKSVLRMIVKDSEDREHVVSKHYVYTKECHVCMTMAEKNLVDKHLRRQDCDDHSGNENDTNHTSSDGDSDQLGTNRTKRSPRERKRRRLSFTSSSSTTDSYSPPSYSGSDNGSSQTQDDSYYSPDNSLYSDASDNTTCTLLSEVPDEYTDAGGDSCISSDSAATKRTPRRKKMKTARKSKKTADLGNCADSSGYSDDDDIKMKGDSTWRKDPLLQRIRLDVSGSSDTMDSFDDGATEIIQHNSDAETGAEAIPTKRARLSLNRSRLSDDSDVNVKVESISPTKSVTKPLPKDSDDDSDVEIVNGDADDSQARKGRRNIKDILSKDHLHAATRAATEEEKERLKRLQAKAARWSQMAQSQLSVALTTDTMPSDLILDANEAHPTAVEARLAQRLYPHQRAGIQFLWDNCFESVERLQEGDKGGGCILAHCMGLGKTFQVVTLVHTLFKHSATTGTKHVLVICPLTTLNNWRSEFLQALRLVSRKPTFDVVSCGAMTNQFPAHLRKVLDWRRRGGVLLIGYQAFVALVKRDEQDVNVALLEPGPDLVVCDEGHLLKSGDSRRTQAISRINTRRRIILTGTPMQNNLEEYYSMVGFVKPSYLGTMKEYRNRFVNPINNGQFEDSNHADIQKMRKRSHVLHKMTQGFIQRFEETELTQHLPPKYDYAIKLKMCDLQIALLQEFLRVCCFKDLFANVQIIRGICAHPYLLHAQATARAQNKNKKRVRNEVAELLTALNRVDPNWWRGKLPTDVATNIHYGPKLLIMMAIIRETNARGEKLLVFSSSLLELDLIERYLQASDADAAGGKWAHERNYYRIDGSVMNSVRDQYTRSFNAPASPIKLMLLTQKVGGIGLNFCAANRAIIMDVSWNPADDMQSVFRIYRIGQTKPCYVYRLIAMGTTEEVIYERSVTKQAIANRVVDEMQITRHFQSSELEAMYRCKMVSAAERPNFMPPKDTLLANLLQQHACIHHYQDHKELLQNLPHEGLDDAEMQLAWEEYEREKNAAPLMPHYPEGAPAGIFPAAGAATGPCDVQCVGTVPNFPNAINLPSATAAPSVPGNVNLVPRATVLRSVASTSGDSALSLPERFTSNALPLPVPIYPVVSSNPNPVIEKAVFKNKSTAVNSEVQSPWQGITLLFESPTTKGGRVLAQFNEWGRVANNKMADRLTEQQIRMAEGANLINPQHLKEKMYVITRNGILRPLDANSNRSMNGARAPPTPTAVPPPAPKITASINLVEEDVESEVIEINDL